MRSSELVGCERLWQASLKNKTSIIAIIDPHPIQCLHQRCPKTPFTSLLFKNVASRCGMTRVGNTATTGRLHPAGFPLYPLISPSAPCLSVACPSPTSLRDQLTCSFVPTPLSGNILLYRFCPPSGIVDGIKGSILRPYHHLNLKERIYHLGDMPR